MLILTLASCTSMPQDEFFLNEIQRMVRIDEGLEFKEEIAGIEILKKTSNKIQVEVEVKVTGWATHRELSIGATLPASNNRRKGWAVWKFFCVKNGKLWEIKEKYKIDEGWM
jgi:hypothetical protein